MFLLRYLPREVDPLVYNMSHEDPGNITYSMIGGLSEQIRELREVSLLLYFKLLSTSSFNFKFCFLPNVFLHPDMLLNVPHMKNFRTELLVLKCLLQISYLNVTYLKKLFLDVCFLG